MAYIIFRLLVLFIGFSTILIFLVGLFVPHFYINYLIDKEITREIINYNAIKYYNRIKKDLQTKGYSNFTLYYTFNKEKYMNYTIIFLRPNKLFVELNYSTYDMDSRELLPYKELFKKDKEYSLDEIEEYLNKIARELSFDDLYMKQLAYNEKINMLERQIQEKKDNKKKNFMVRILKHKKIMITPIDIIKS